MKLTKKAKVIATTTGLVVVIGLGVAFTCLERVPAGYVAGQFSMKGGVIKEVLTPGFHFVSPTIKTSLYSTATESLIWSADKKEGSKDDESFMVTCKDGTLKADFEMSYSFDADAIPAVMNKFRGINGEDIVHVKLPAKIRNYINEETAKFNIMDAYLEQKTELNANILTRLNKELAVYGVTVESANLITTPDAKLAASIAERAAANEQLEKIKLDKQIAEEEAAKRIIEEEGKKKAAIIAAEAKAESNKKVEQSLTPEMLQQQWIDKWDGKLPQVSGAENIVTGIK